MHWSIHSKQKLQMRAYLMPVPFIFFRENFYIHVFHVIPDQHKRYIICCPWRWEFNSLRKRLYQDPKAWLIIGSCGNRKQITKEICENLFFRYREKNRNVELKAYIANPFDIKKKAKSPCDESFSRFTFVKQTRINIFDRGFYVSVHDLKCIPSRQLHVQS